MRVKKFNKNAILPCRTHSTDAGLDIFLPEPLTLKAFETKTIGTGLGFEIPEGYAGIFIVRSSMGKKGIYISPCIVDSGYTGETHLMISNMTEENYSFNQGDRLCSLVLFNILTPTLTEVEEFQETERGSKGLGSSGV